MKAFMRILCAILLPFSLLASGASLMTLEVGAEEESTPRLLEGKTYSILGDSISTYTDVSAGVERSARRPLNTVRPSKDRWVQASPSG